MFVDAFNKLGMSIKEVGLFHNAFVRFVEEQVQVRGHIELLITFAGTQAILVKFLTVKR